MKTKHFYIAAITLFLIIVSNESRPLRKREHRRLRKRFSNPLLVRYNVQRKYNDVPPKIEHKLNLHRNEIMENIDSINSIVNKNLDKDEKIYAEVKLNFENPNFRVQAYFTEDLNGQVKVPAVGLTSENAQEVTDSDELDVIPDVSDTEEPTTSTPDVTFTDEQQMTTTPDVDKHVYSTESATPAVETTDDDEFETSSGDGDVFTSTEERTLPKKESTHFFETEIITPKRIYNLLQ